MKWVISSFCAFGSSTSALEEVGFCKPKWDPRKQSTYLKLDLEAKLLLVLQQYVVTVLIPSLSPFWSVLNATDWQISVCFLISNHCLWRTSNSHFWSRTYLPLLLLQIILTGVHFINAFRRHQCSCPLYCQSACVPIGLENNPLAYLDESCSSLK